MNKKPVFCKKLTIINELGLHARPAAIIAKIARETKGSVSLKTKGRTVNAASMIDILTLSCSKDTDVIVSVNHESDLEILKKIELVITSGFGE